MASSTYPVKVNACRSTKAVGSLNLTSPQTCQPTPRFVRLASQSSKRPTLRQLARTSCITAVETTDPYPTITIPVSVWLLVGFLKGIPKDIEEQAMVDGYSRFAAFIRAVVPLVFPGIVAVIVFSFTLTAASSSRRSLSSHQPLGR
jgi:hypothetical protein